MVLDSFFSNLSANETGKLPLKDMATYVARLTVIVIVIVVIIIPKKTVRCS